MKKLLLSTLLLLLPLLASAYDIAVENDDGVTIYYNLIPKGNVAKVAYSNSYSGSVTIPDKFTYDGVEYTVTIIGGSAFYDCSGLTSVKIPNSVTTIESHAFMNCTGLTSVHISDLAAWCKIAFSDSNYSNPLFYAHHLFLNGEEVKDLVIPNTVTSIGNMAFSYCEGLTSVTIPNSVITIGEAAFYACTGLTSVTIPNSVTSIGNTAFHYCTSLTSVTIGNSVTSIGNSAFSHCTSLPSVTIPNSVTTIGDYAFQNCSTLTSLTIPNSVTTIGGSAFYNCSGLTSVTIGNSVTSIGNSAFSHCTSLPSVTIPNSVTTIGNEAFEGCTSVTSVTIGSSVRSINQKAFAACSKLEEVYCLAENVPLTSTDTFEESYTEYTTLYVPAESLNDYKTTEPWSMFGTIKAITGTGEEPTICATPTIGYGNKKLKFSCDTEGVTYVYEIKIADAKKGYEAEVDLSATYEISVYATKAGYWDSEVATATLVWMSAQYEGAEPIVTPANAPTERVPVLISSRDGNLTVKSELDGQNVAVYTIDGKALGSAKVKGGQAVIATNLQKGTIVVVKVGDRSVKISI